MAAAPSGVIMGEVEALVDLQREVHNAIRERGFSKESKERCIERVNRCLDNAPADVDKVWPDHGGESRQSAMYRAISHNAFDVYCLLWSRECQFKDAAEQEEIFNYVSPIRKSELQYQLACFAQRYKDAHVNYLKSCSFGNRGGLNEELDCLYRELNRDELIRTVLEVAATSRGLRILYDFDSEDVQCMTGLPNKHTHGLTNPQGHTIHIAAKRTREEIIGTLAHELCHLAVLLVYENDGKPYRSDSGTDRKRYRRVLGDTRRRRGEERILRDVFMGERQEEELIVRVPHVLAKYRYLEYGRMEEDAHQHQETGHRGITLLDNQAQSLFKYFTKVVTPDMKKYLTRFRSEIGTEEISHTNERLGKACRTEDLGVTFRETPSQEELEDVPLLVCTAPNFTLLEAMVNNLVKAMKLPYLFLEAKKWNETVESVLSKNKCDVVILSNPCNAVHEDRCVRMAEILNELSEVRGTRVILVTANEQTDRIARALREQSLFVGHMKSYEKHDSKALSYSKVISEACFLNVDEDCKENVLRSSWIKFQGSHEELSDWTKSDLNCLVSAMDEDTFMALCQSKVLEVGPQLREDTRGYYVNRTCEKKVESSYEVTYEEGHLVTATEKIVIVTGAPGIGKSRLASRISETIKKQGKRQWVLHVDLLNVSKEITSLNVEGIWSDLENFAEFCGVKKQGFEFALFKMSISADSPFHVVLILDAFDEICEENQEKLLCLVRILAQGKVSKIFVFSRSVFKDKLADRLQTVSYELLPFTAQGQQAFLKHYKGRAVSDAVPRENPSTTQRLHNINHMLRYDETLLGTPFFLGVVAALENGEVIDGIDPDVLRKACESSGSEKYLGIYKVAIEYRYFQHRKEKKREDFSRACVNDDDVVLKQHFYNTHQTLAMKAVFNDDICQFILFEEERAKFQNNNDPTNLLNQVSKNSLKHGLLDGLRDGRPVFKPRSIAEFWAAERLFSKIAALPSASFSSACSSSGDELPRLAFRMYGEDTYKGVTKFLDSFGMISNEFHFAVMNRDVVYLRSCVGNQDCDRLERKPMHIAALHADGDTISALPSIETGSLEEEDKLGATPFDYVHQQHEWTRLHAICSQCSNGILNRDVSITRAIGGSTLVTNSYLHLIVARDLKYLRNWLQREPDVRCPSNSSGKAQFLYVKSPAALNDLLHLCNVQVAGKTFKAVDETHRIAPNENHNHKYWNDMTQCFPHSTVGGTDKDGRVPLHPGAKCQCSAVVMLLVPGSDPNSAEVYEAQQGTELIHMWFCLSPGCREIKNSQTVRRFQTNLAVDEESSDKWRDHRANMHKAIDDRNVDEVRKCLQVAPHLKLWVHPSRDETALHRAVEKQRMAICRLLRDHGCRMKDEETSDCSHEDANFEVFSRRFYDNQPHQTLRSHTEGRPDTEDNKGRTDDLYGHLEANDLLRPILNVVGTSPNANIILDYDKESVDTVVGTLENPNHGLTDLKTETIYVAAKRDKDEVLGTLAHELCHLALDFVYRNGGKPYLRTDSERKHFYGTIIDTVRKKEDKVDVLLREVFGEHDKEELIARVPHLLAKYGTSGDGNIILEKEAPDLFEFFKDLVIPDMIAYTKNSFPTRDQARLEAENLRLRHADQTEDRQVKLSEDLDYRELSDAPILILTAPNLQALEIMAYNAVKSTEQTHLFFRSSQWNPRLQDVLLSNCCKFILITCDLDIYIQNMLELFIELNEVAGTQIILLAQEDNVANLVQNLENQPFLANAHKVKNVSNAHLDMVTEDTKRKILRTSQVCFQKSAEPLWLEDLLDLKEDGKIPDEVTCLMSCQLKKIEVGQPVPQLEQRVSEYYVERKCERIVVDVKSLQSSSSDEAFAFCGDELWKIRDRLCPGTKLFYFRHVRQFQTYVYLETSDEYEVLRKTKFYEGKVVHLLQYDAASQAFLLIASNGHLPVAGKQTFSEIDLVDINDAVVICGLPGMGKSFLALRFCEMIKEKDERHWVLYVDLSKINLALRSLEIGDESGQLMRLAALCGLKGEGLEFMLFQRSMNTGRPFKVTAVFDAFDELEEGSRENVLHLTEFLTRTKVWKVFVFSRNIFKAVIQDRLRVMPFELCPFTAEDKVEFIKKYGKLALVRARDEGFTKQNMLLKLWLTDVPEVSGNPLLLRVAIEDQTLDDFSNPLEIHTSRNVNLVTLYGMLAEYKYVIYRKEKRNDNVLLSAVKDDYDVLRKQLYHDHELLAAKATLGDELNKQVLTDQEWNDLETRVMNFVLENRLRHGFVDGKTNGHPVFVSNTFSEYFAAHLLFRKVTTTKSPNVVEILQAMYSQRICGHCVVSLSCLEEAISMSVAALKDFRNRWPTPSSTLGFGEQTYKCVVSKKVSQGTYQQSDYDQYLDTVCYLEKAIYKYCEALMYYTPTTYSEARTEYKVSYACTQKVASKSLSKLKTVQCVYPKFDTQTNLIGLRCLEEAIFKSCEILEDFTFMYKKCDTERECPDHLTPRRRTYLEIIQGAYMEGNYDKIRSTFHALFATASTILEGLRSRYTNLSRTFVTEEAYKAHVDKHGVLDKFSQVKHHRALTFFDSCGAVPCSIHTAIINGNSPDIDKKSMNTLDELERTPLHVAALYASPEFLKNLPLTDELPGKDLLGMTPLMYADKTCAWRRLDILCARHKNENIEWDDQIPTVLRNIKEKRRLGESVLCECIEMELQHLLGIILSQCCSLVYNATKSDETSGKHAELQNGVHIDCIRGNRSETPLFRAQSLSIFLLLLPYSSLEAIDYYQNTLLHESAREGRVDIAKRLLIRLTAIRRYKLTPLDLAVEHGHNAVVKLLLPHSSPDVTFNGLSLLFRPYNVQPGILKLLHPHLRRVATDESALHELIICSNWHTVVCAIPYLNVHATARDPGPFFGHTAYPKTESRQLHMSKMIKLFLLRSDVRNWKTFLYRPNLVDIHSVQDVKLLLPHL